MGSGQEVLPAAGLAREWLITNGAGGCACGTAAGPPARRGHAWLHAAARDGHVTTLLLAMEEQVGTGGAVFALSALPGCDDTVAAAELETFSADPWPRWRLRCGEAVFERSLFLVHGQQAVVVSYTHVSGPAARLRLGPLVVARDPDGLQRETPEMQGVARGIPGRVRIETTQGQPALTLWHNGSFLPARLWRRGILYPADGAARPAEPEDAFIPGTVECPLSPGESAHLVASTEEGLFRALAIEGRLGAPPPDTLAGCVAALARWERLRQDEFRAEALRGAAITSREAAAAHGDEARGPGPDEDDAWTARLARGLESCLSRRGGRLTLLDGFPAASERGEEALRAVPGLIAVRAFEVAKAILNGYLEYLDDGLAPAAFDPEGGARYDDAAPSLWLLIGAELLTRRSEDLDWARSALPRLESIAQHYRAGSRYGIQVDHDGLLRGGGDDAVKPAALNVLWYHALVAMAQLARLSGRKEGAAFYLAWARQHGQCFNDTFWDEGGGCLYDSVAASGPVPGFGPAQLYAVSLSPSLLPPERAGRLVERAERELFTPLGLRPAPGIARVEAVWLGLFHAACLRVHGRGAEVQARVRSRLTALRTRLDEVATDHVPAAFEPPARRSNGRRASAEAPLETWAPIGVSPAATAELLRLWVEEIAHGS